MAAPLLCKFFPELEAVFSIFVNATFRARDLLRSRPLLHRYYPPITVQQSLLIKAHVTVDPTATQLYLVRPDEIRYF